MYTIAKYFSIALLAATVLAAGLAASDVVFTDFGYRYFSQELWSNLAEGKF